jgi:oligoendopeptidase F
MTEKAIPERDRVEASSKWDLTPLFDGDDGWKALYAELEAEIPLYERYRGRLAASAETFKAAIDFHLDLSRKMERIYTYAHLRSDENKSNDLYLGLYQQAVSLYTRISQASSYMTPEIQSIPDETLQNFRSDGFLGEYDFFLEKIVRYKPHTLDETAESILAMSQEMAQTASQVFGQLDNVDLNFGTLTDASGTRVELSHGNFVTFLSSPDRKLRKRAFGQYYRQYDDHRHTLAAALGQSIKKDLFYAKARKFDNCRQAALFGDRVQDAVYDNLIRTVRDNLAPLFKYLAFRREALGLDTLHFFDTYVPIIKNIRFEKTYEAAVEEIVEALAPLGTPYTRTLKQGLVGGWVDRYENRGKRSGAYSSGCYDSPPYILLNYEPENLNSLYTLIHEAGHSMHSYFARKHQPYVDHDYTIFVAEVASTFNEILLSNHLLEVYQNDPAMKAYILNREIDNIRATLYRQTMFAEFEKKTHELAEQHQPLTLEVFTATYRTLLEAYFGDALVIDDRLPLECLRIPHFYSAFYVYKYATGISAAIALAQKVLGEGDPARDRYLDFLKLGGSKFPLDALLEAGVDMETPEPIAAAITYFSKRVDGLIAVYSKLG